jgi:hypothetical protein
LPVLAIIAPDFYGKHAKISSSVENNAAQQQDPFDELSYEK